ncbi:helix-turn-helix domain-containing protein [Streptomyces sp. N2-109]|uniref:Helix-turn-helix domain-containing protein n=1 Tax=Streptomyces gossypii TaxID=2883101 RepID=A0ABT2JPX6_9ACTN|nr:helix-turn-helix domain-containing protein [Streptomyces gossypii]MCT2589861.1 helix-turn-helix domain-containing protein [Streptomyces gossypii]
MGSSQGSGTQDTGDARAQRPEQRRQQAAGGSYSFVRAPQPRGGAIASMIGYRVTDGDPFLHRGLPSPALTLVFSLDEPIVSGESAAHAESARAYRTEIVVGGLHQRPAYVRQPSDQAGIQLAVHPLAARALLGIPARELTRIADEGSDVLGSQASLVREQLCDQSGWAERFTTLTDFLRQRAAAGAERGSGVRPEVAEAWRWLASRRGTGSMDGLARHVALSARQLTTLFRQEVGMSPKQVSRLMRWERAQQAVTSAVADERRPDLAAIAVRCGFYDHSHLVRDFHQYTGLSPTAWITEERRNIQAGGHRNGEGWQV